MDKISVKQNTFGISYMFTNTPDAWLIVDEEDIWFTVWSPGDPETIICQKHCTFQDDHFWITLIEGDFDAIPGIYYWELAHYEDGVKRDPTFTGELEILESPQMPSEE